MAVWLVALDSVAPSEFSGGGGGGGGGSCSTIIIITSENQHHRGKVIGAKLHCRRCTCLRYPINHLRTFFHLSMTMNINHILHYRDTFPQLAAAYQSMKSEYASAVFAQQHSTTTTITSSASSTATSGHSRQILSTHPDGSEVSLLEHPHDPYCPYVRMTPLLCLELCKMFG